MTERGHGMKGQHRPRVYVIGTGGSISCIGEQRTDFINYNYADRHFTIEEMLGQAEKRPLVCGIALHPFVIGQPFRLRLLRQALKHCIAHARREQVWYTVPGKIAEHCYALPEHLLPGDSRV